MPAPDFGSGSGIPSGVTKFAGPRCRSLLSSWHLWATDTDRFVCHALQVSAGDDFRIAPFDPAMQDAFRLLVLDGMEERWGFVDESLAADLEDVDAHYGNDCVLVALHNTQVVGTGILLLRAAEGEIVRMSVHREYRRRGIATQLLAKLVHLASEYGVNRVVVETNAKWMEAQYLYEASGFKFTYSAPGAFGRETFYELLI
jgi:GNAT superfamily N-acetyltransferase